MITSINTSIVMTKLAISRVRFEFYCSSKNRKNKVSFCYQINRSPSRACFCQHVIRCITCPNILTLKRLQDRRDMLTRQISWTLPKGAVPHSSPPEVLPIRMLLFERQHQQRAFTILELNKKQVLPAVKGIHDFTDSSWQRGLN